MKKILAIVLIMAMSASLLIGCGGSDKDTSADVNQENNDSEEEKVIIDTSIYSEKIELVTEENQKVQVYYDPTVVNCITGEDQMGEYCYLGEMINPSVTDAESAQAYVDAIISYNEGYLEIGEQKEIALGDYVVDYFSLQDTESGGFAGEIWVIELGSNVILTFNYIGSAEEGGQLDTELAAIKFVVGDVTIESNQKDNNDTEIEANLQTYEFSAEYYLDDNETGILTYNGDFVEFTEGDDHFSSFDLTIKDGGSYTFGVTLHCQSNSNAEIYYQDRLGNLGEYDVSELKETVINDIPVKYFTYVKKTDGDRNKFLNCMIDFPDSDYKSRVVILDMFLMLEEDVMLEGLENLLVDIEIQGAKPGSIAENTSVKNDEVDEDNYWSEYLKTSDGKNVTIYIDKNAVNDGITWTVDSQEPSSIYIYDKNQDVCYFSVNDASTAEEYANNVIQWNDYLEIGTQEEIQLAGRTLYKYHFVDKETGEVFISEGVIELASDVVFTFTYNHMKYEESGLEEVLEALKFVVEE